MEEKFSMNESIQAGAPDITYSGNEGPKSPQQEQEMQKMRMMASNPSLEDSRNEMMENIALDVFGKPLSDLSEDEIIQIEIMMEEMSKKSTAPRMMAGWKDLIDVNHPSFVPDSWKDLVDTNHSSYDKNYESLSKGGRTGYAGGGPMDTGEDEQGKQIAAEIWSQMEPEQKVQFQSFEAFFQSGIWKQILQQLQQDQSGIRSQAPEMSMSENVNVAEQMPGGGIADVDVREKVAMAANGGLMGLYNRGM